MSMLTLKTCSFVGIIIQILLETVKTERMVMQGVEHIRALLD
jgi:hypothetical protein